MEDEERELVIFYRKISEIWRDRYPQLPPLRHEDFMP
jgi:hypothetical protein